MPCTDCMAGDQPSGMKQASASREQMASLDDACDDGASVRMEMEGEGWAMR